MWWRQSGLRTAGACLEMRIAVRAAPSGRGPAVVPATGCRPTLMNRERASCRLRYLGPSRAQRHLPNWTTLDLVRRPTSSEERSDNVIPDRGQQIPGSDGKEESFRAPGSRPSFEADDRIVLTANGRQQPHNNISWTIVVCLGIHYLAPLGLSRAKLK